MTRRSEVVLQRTLMLSGTLELDYDEELGDLTASELVDRLLEAGNSWEDAVDCVVSIEEGY